MPLKNIFKRWIVQFNPSRIGLAALQQWSQRLAVRLTPRVQLVAARVPVPDRGGVPARGKLQMD